MNADMQYPIRVVAFLDILGFKRIIERLESEDGKSAFSDILDALSYLNNKREKTYDNITIQLLGGRLSTDTVEVSVFSDHIVLSDTIENIFSVIFKTKLISRGLFQNGLLCRGGITCGKLFHKKQIVFGQGLVDAHKLESTVAIYPRIIIDNDVAQKYLESQKKNKKQFQFRDYIKQDSDSRWFIDHFSGPFIGSKSDFLAITRQFIIGSLDNFSDEPRIFEKYRWLAAQFNQSKHIDDPIDLTQSTSERNTMPTISMFYGILIRMFFNDIERHHLPHIHAEYQGQVGTYAIPDGSLLAGELPPSKHKLVVAWIEIHQDDLLADWELAVNGKKPFPIKGLDQ